MVEMFKVLCVFLLFLFQISSSFPKNNGKVPIVANEVQRQNSDDVKQVIRKSNLKKKAVIDLSNMHSRGLSNLKKTMEHKVEQAHLKVNRSGELSPKEKAFKFHVLEMFLEELRESERDMVEAEEALKKSLSADFWNASTLKENSRRRLEGLRVATLKEEKSFNRMHEFEENMKSLVSKSNHSSWMSELLDEIAHAADDLQDRVAEHDLSPDELNRGHIEAVVHMRDYDIINDNYEDDNRDVLVDSHNNKYILSRQTDATSPFIDHVLVTHVLSILLLSVPLGGACQALGVPSLFGFILTGVVLGPAGLNVIQEMVQIETIGELGVFMIMFCAGLEFSLDGMNKIWRVAIQVPVYVTALMMLAGVVIGQLFMEGIPTTESLFISACLSLSSTPLVTRFLQHGSKESCAAEYSSILLGILVMQDIQLSLIISVLPGLSIGHKESSGSVFLHTSAIVVQTFLSLLLVVAVVVATARFVMPHYLKFVAHQSRDIQLLGTLAVMFVCLMFTSSTGVSMELGCFLAGAAISYSSHQSSIEQRVFAVHDFLSVIFFATIGFHVFPTFVFVELSVLAYLTAFIVAGKYLISVLVLRWVLPPSSRKFEWIVSSGLAQVSEFSFVLGSRARHLKIISREVYLMILSVTTLSLLLAPVLWKLSLWRYRVRHSLTGHIS